MQQLFWQDAILKNMKYRNKVKYVFGLMGLVLIFVLFCKPAGMRNSSVLSDATIYKQIDNFSIKINNIEELLDGEVTGIIYFGRDTCNFCTAFNALLVECYKEIEDLKIYKFDTDKWRNDEKYDNILRKYNVQQVPALVKIKENREISIFSTEKDTDEEIKKELLEFLEDSIN